MTTTTNTAKHLRTAVHPGWTTDSHAAPEEGQRLERLGGPFAFWNHPDEDIYTFEDGEPIDN